MIMDETPWNKNNWKIVVKRAISEFQENNWREEISSLSHDRTISGQTFAGFFYLVFSECIKYNINTLVLHNL